MKIVSKTVLKAKMFEYFREIEKTGEELIVAEHGRPVLKVSPIKAKQSVKDVFLGFSGHVTYGEDINTPTTNEWPKT
ncbi:MAG TPA: prevent-host-death protein [Myxococcota bacterium]|nr:prevent-host-death protein [Myxococcota bacterium]